MQEAVSWFSQSCWRHRIPRLVSTWRDDGQVGRRHVHVEDPAWTRKGQEGEVGSSDVWGRSRCLIKLDPSEEWEDSDDATTDEEEEEDGE